MYLYICTLFLFCQSIYLLLSRFPGFPCTKHLWAKQIQSAHIPSNPTAADRWLSLQTREAFIYSGLSCRPSMEEKLCGRGRRESIWASKAPEELWGCCQQEKKWLHRLTWWGFWFQLPPLGSPLWPRPSFQVSVWSGRQKGHNPCGHSRFGAMAGGWP